MDEVTCVLSAIKQGDPDAAGQLLPLVYDELRELAAQRAGPGEARARRSRPPPWSTKRTCGWWAPTRAAHWDGRGHFFAAAAEAMRRILIDRAREAGRPKRGGGWRRVRLDRIDSLVAEAPDDDLLDLDDALDAAAQRGSRAAAELVKLRFFAGLTLEEAAEALGVVRAHRRSLLGVCPGLAFAELGRGRGAGRETVIRKSSRACRTGFRSDGA